MSESIFNFKSNILGGVKNGLKNACNDMIRFTNKWALQIKAESLITVNIAQSIDKSINYSPGDPYQIYLEKKTKNFSLDCITPVNLKNWRSKIGNSHRKKVIPVERNGRIDIAVYSNDTNNGYWGSPQPICVIEVKGVNSARKQIIKDLKRNLGYFHLFGNTGNSVIEYAVFATIVSMPSINKKTDVANNEVKIKTKYTKWLSEVGSMSGILINVEAYTISSELIGRVEDEGYEKVIYVKERHHYIGVIITFEKNN